MVTDTLADMLTRIKNATMVNKKTVSMPYAKMCKAVADVMLAENYLKAVSVEGEGKDKKLVLTPMYVSGKSAIQHIRRISKPGVRIYSPVSELRSVLSGMGISIISTSKGIMTDKGAKKARVGGEVLAELW